MAYLSHSIRKKLSVLLLGLFLLYTILPVAGYFLWKVYVQFELESIAQKLPKTSLIAFTLPLSNELDSEFESDGNMYDIISVDTNQATKSITCYCIRDVIEELLIDDQIDEDESPALSSAKKDYGKRALKWLQQPGDGLCHRMETPPVVFASGILFSLYRSYKPFASTRSVDRPPEIG